MSITIQTRRSGLGEQGVAASTKALQDGVLSTTLPAYLPGYGVYPAGVQLHGQLLLQQMTKSYCLSQTILWEQHAVQSANSSSAASRH